MRSSQPCSRRPGVSRDARIVAIPIADPQADARTKHSSASSGGLEPFQGGSYSQGIERYRIARMSSGAGDDPTAVAWSLPALLRSFDLAGARTRLRTSDLACEEVRDPCP
jgi:hypothetical protein